MSNFPACRRCTTARQAMSKVTSNANANANPSSLRNDGQCKETRLRKPSSGAARNVEQRINGDEKTRNRQHLTEDRKLPAPISVAIGVNCKLKRLRVYRKTPLRKPTLGDARDQ
jgi:hypothetical protein